MNRKLTIVAVLFLFMGLMVAAKALKEGSLTHEGHSDLHAEEADHGHEHGEDHGERETNEREDPHDDHGEAEHQDHKGHDHGAHGDVDGVCPEHFIAEVEDALCHSDRIADLQPGEGMMVRLASLESAKRAGITTAVPHMVSLTGEAGFPGQAGFNRNRFARVAPLAAGIVQKVLVQPGAKVEKGEVLAEVVMPEITSMKAQLMSAQARRVQARETYLREKDLLEQGITSRQEYQKADAEYRAAKSEAAQFHQQLLNYGLSEDDVQELLRAQGNRSVLQVRAPFNGVVVEMKTAMGESVAAGSPLFTVADLDTLWIELSIPESRIYQAEVGADVDARFDGLPGTVFKGRIFQLGAALDERSRVLKVLADVDNPGHRLKAGMFGQVRLLTEADKGILGVPANALQSIDGFAYLFVRVEEDLFELRRVKAGVQQDGMVPIHAGIDHEDQVVTSQAFALKSEVLKARLGASCADH